MIYVRRCIEIVKNLIQLSEDEIKKVIEKNAFLWNIPPVRGPFLQLYHEYKTLDLLKFVLELKENEELLDKLSKEILKKEERIKFLEKKQSNIDEIIQEKISQKLKQYEEKIKQLEKENKELKEQLGYYE